MNRFILTAIVPCLILSSCERSSVPPEVHKATHDHKAHWSYNGDTGPEHWADLDPAWTVAKSGKNQSPIDLSSASQPQDLTDLETDYKPTSVDLKNNGHTIVQSYREGSTVSVGDKAYELKQFHFHHKSEHTVDGDSFDMECHLVHANEAGNLLVVGVFIKEGNENSFLKQLWTDMPEVADEATKSAQEINVENFLPADLSYYHYQGSLTTPPCTEGVQWYVLAEPVEASADQISKFAKIFPNNNRPVQILFNRRIVLSDD